MSAGCGSVFGDGSVVKLKLKNDVLSFLFKQNARSLLLKLSKNLIFYFLFNRHNRPH